MKPFSRNFVPPASDRIRDTRSVYDLGRSLGNAAAASQEYQTGLRATAAQSVRRTRARPERKRIGRREADALPG